MAKRKIAVFKKTPIGNKTIPIGQIDLATGYFVEDIFNGFHHANSFDEVTENLTAIIPGLRIEGISQKSMLYSVNEGEDKVFLRVVIKKWTTQNCPAGTN